MTVKYNHSRNLSDSKLIFNWLQKNQHGVKKAKPPWETFYNPVQIPRGNLFSKKVKLL